MCVGGVHKARILKKIGAAVLLCSFLSTSSVYAATTLSDADWTETTQTGDGSWNFDGNAGRLTLRNGEFELHCQNDNLRYGIYNEGGIIKEGSEVGSIPVYNEGAHRGRKLQL